MPNNPKTNVRPRSFYSFLILGAALLAFIQTFSLLSPILFSFLLILLISLAVNPLISRMRAFKGGRKGATGLIVAALVVFIALTGWAFFGPMQGAVTKLAERLPTYWERLQKPLIKMEQQAVLSEEKLQAEVTTEIAQTAAEEGKLKAARQPPKPALPKTTKESESIRSRLGQMIQGVVGSFTAVAFNAAQILVVLVTVFFGVIFTLMDPRPIFGAIFLIVPERHHEQTLTILQRVGRFVPTWALATLLAMLTVGLLVFLLMCPFFGFVDALVLGIIAGVFEAIPYLGPILSAVPALLFAMGEGGMTPVWVLFAYLTVQVLENNVICPMIMARSMKLHSVAVIFSMLLCVAAFGLLGVLVAAPLVAIVNIVHDELYRKRFLPAVTDADLDRLARNALREKQSVSK
ncbi:MAG: AI-2E family transporter [Geobacteraceae bacterium]|nr:MAG: AI-2E family transporter [Geobacteraceae bacterium]